MSEPKFTGVWIPAGVFQTSMVSLAAKVVYGVVDALDNEDGCFASNAYLSRHLGLGERQIRNLLSELEDAKLIVRVEESGRRVIRTVEKLAVQQALADGQVTRTEGAATDCRGGRQKIATGGGKKLPPYNKEDNKEDNNKSIPWADDVKPPFSSEAFAKAWQSWIDYRKEIKKTLKPTTVQAQWRQFVLWGEANTIKSIETSIKNGWTGLFEPRNSLPQFNRQPLQAHDHNEF